MGIIFRYLFARRIYSCFEVLKLIFWTAQYTLLFFFNRLVSRLTQFELSRVKLCKTHLKGSKKYFVLAGGWSNQGFELQRVKLQ